MPPEVNVRHPGVVTGGVVESHDVPMGYKGEAKSVSCPKMDLQEKADKVILLHVIKDSDTEIGINLIIISFKANYLYKL